MTENMSLADRDAERGAFEALHDLCDAGHAELHVATVPAALRSHVDGFAWLTPEIGFLGDAEYRYRG